MSDGMFIQSPGSCPRGTVGGGSKIEFFRNSIKFGMRVTHVTDMYGACNSLISLAPPPGTLGRCQKVFLQECGDLQWLTIDPVLVFILVFFPNGVSGQMWYLIVLVDS